MPQLVVLHDDLAEIKCHVHGYHNIPAKRWHFDGNLECPTFSPSVREFESVGGGVTRCHFTVTAGMICYHDDNSHAFAGQTLPMLPFTPEEVGDEHWVTKQFEQDEKNKA